MEIPLTLTLDDISAIGHTVFQNEGNTIFVCNMDTAGIEAILLRTILKALGYELISATDSGDEDDNVDLNTNLPWDQFEKLMTPTAESE